MIRFTVLCALGLLTAACESGLGPMGDLRIGDQRSQIAPAGGCREAFLKPTAGVCGEVDSDPAQALVSEPIRIGASRKFTFKADSHRFQAIQISLITDLQKTPFTVLWTHTYDGNELAEDLSALAPGIYVAEILAISTQERSNAFYRFAIEVPSSNELTAVPSVPQPAP